MLTFQAALWQLVRVLSVPIGICTNWYLAGENVFLLMKTLWALSELHACDACMQLMHDSSHAMHDYLTVIG
jgi:small-conductance mechanosensitive channel